MRTFTFFFIRSGALVAPFEIELFETLDEAIAHAHKTLARQNYESVEIIEDGEAVFSTMAPSLIVTELPPSRTPAPSGDPQLYPRVLPSHPPPSP